MAAPVFDAVSGGNFIGNVSTASWSHTCSGSNRALYVQVHLDLGAGTQVTSTLTYNGVSMSLVDSRRATGQANQAQNGSLEVWELINPASGSHTVAWAGNSGGSASVTAQSISFSDVDQSTPKGTTNGAGSMNTNAPSLSITSATGELAVCFASGQQAGLTYTQNGSQTSRFAWNSSREHCSTVAGAGSLSMGYGIDFAEDIAMIGFSLKPVSGGGGATAVTFGTHPTSGAVNAASTNITIGTDTTPITGTLVVTPASNKAGTFSPTTVSLTTGSPTATVTFTPTVSGVHTISSTNNGGLSNPSTYTYTVAPAITFTVVTSSTDSTPRASLSNLHWRWFDVTDVDSAAAPVNHGSTATTDGSGVCTIALPNSTLVNGQDGRLDITDSTGTSLTDCVVLTVT